MPLDDVLRDPRFVPMRGRGVEIRSLLRVPLTTSGSVTGCLLVASARWVAFAAAHENLALLLAGVASSRIERASSRSRYVTRRDDAGVRAAPCRAARCGGGRAATARGWDGRADCARARPLWRDARRAGARRGGCAVRVALDRIMAVVGAQGVVIRRDGADAVVAMPQTRAEEAEIFADRTTEALGGRVTEPGPGFQTTELAACMGVVGLQWRRVADSLRAARRRDVAPREGARSGLDRSVEFRGAGRGSMISVHRRMPHVCGRPATVLAHETRGGGPDAAEVR